MTFFQYQLINALTFFLVGYFVFLLVSISCFNSRSSMRFLPFSYILFSLSIRFAPSLSSLRYSFLPFPPFLSCSPFFLLYLILFFLLFFLFLLFFSIFSGEKLQMWNNTNKRRKHNQVIMERKHACDQCEYSTNYTSNLIWNSTNKASMKEWDILVTSVNILLYTSVNMPQLHYPI